ncbi:hypothetical protein XYCOK13_29610 [Xylanibacillus composti]|uniref:Inositolphosphotransferase Aur1/Ipt1 domain-containing protein n=1 Tax=Xylanibacillus composti TaxID=1572762 RepID=A0A8J4H5W9_9BACL|nr:phosphatase PAP2 family protein [Xylanibacillus composti]GIQ70137.1 hypothetical protein XYCOK13_29610 [Xylanibacillus composti]
MTLFHSMPHVMAYMIVTMAVLTGFVTRKQPLGAAATFIRQLWTSRKHLYHFIAVLCILLINKLELQVENHLGKQPDFTASFYKLEGNFVYLVQSIFEHPWLTAYTSFFYVVVFSAILMASMVIYSFQRNDTLFYALCYAIMLNYMIAIPFYLFFPVKEVWAFPPIEVRFLMIDVFPTFETTYRNLSGLDNCFPSLHTSLSVTLAILATRSGSRRWKWFTIWSAITVIFSIFCLGIHWFTDMIGGLLLGWFAATFALRLAERDVIWSLLPASIRLKSKKSLPMQEHM